MARKLAQAQVPIRRRLTVLVGLLLLVDAAFGMPAVRLLGPRLPAELTLLDQNGAEEAQRGGECVLGYGCNNFSANYPTGLFATTATDWITVDTCINGGDYAYYSVTAGQSYEWSLCSADGGGTPYDSQLTLWSQDGTTRYCYSDDYCSTASKIAWTATFSGVVRLLVSEFSCADNNTCATLVWRCASCPADMVVITDAWWSSEVDQDGDGCKASARLNWNPDVADCSGTLLVFEKVYWKEGSSGTWTLRTTTSNHAITNCNSDVWYVDYPFDSDCGPFDWKIELYRAGQSSPDYMRDPSNDGDLNDHQEERAADDVAICQGDLNCDGQIDFGDINPFVLYLSNYNAWLTAFPGCDPRNGDIDGNGTYGQGSLGDINPFVAIFSSGPPPYPCP